MQSFPQKAFELDFVALGMLHLHFMAFQSHMLVPGVFHAGVEAGERKHLLTRCMWFLQNGKMSSGLWERMVLRSNSVWSLRSSAQIPTEPFQLRPGRSGVGAVTD